MDILKKLQEEFNLKKHQVENVVKLIDEGNTIPFIARYRKEMTDSLDDQILRQFHERLIYIRNLEDKKIQTIKLIDEQGKLTQEIVDNINKAEILTEIEDIYRPFRPKKRTRATIAKEKGLEELSIAIWEQNINTDIDTLAKKYVDIEKGVNNIEEAKKGALDIIAEMISDNADYRKFIRKLTFDKGILMSKTVDAELKSVYEMYYDYSEVVKTIASHRILALNRAEKEKVLVIKIEAPIEEITNRLQKLIIKKEISNFTQSLIEAIDDSYKRLIAPSIEREIRNELTEKAEEGAIKVFSENLKQLLLQPPIKDKIVLAVDPGFRTGCKLAVVDQTGKVLHTSVGYFTLENHDKQKAKDIITNIIQKYDVDLISIGNGTASRESELFIVDVLKQIPKKIYYVITNEAGASVYSASKLGAEEFPDYDVALRSAVSIGRRLQDPLAELVKIDPKSIGVGQYQHDMNQKRLSETLGTVVEDCVNNVGVDLNTASPSLLQYVSGINSTIAKNIVEYREQNGKFKDRKEIKKVKKLGPKAFEQCAGFLRIPEGEYILDNTGVHPESYKATEKLIDLLGYNLEDIQNKKIKNLKASIDDVNTMAQKLDIGVPTLQDIIKELEKPGRDPRQDMPPVILKDDILDIKDLKDGMILQGTVRNVIDFGAFIDIGVHQDGLVHISEMSNKFIKHPLEVVSVGDIVTVKIINIDMDKNRIALSMKECNM